MSFDTLEFEELAKIRKKLEDKILAGLEKNLDDLVKCYLQELTPRVGPGYMGGGILMEKIAEKIAIRLVEDNYQTIASRVDMDAIIKMVQLRAVGKTFGDK